MTENETKARGTDIEWTDWTWNTTRGCKPKSPGCANCYAAKMGHRLSGEGRPYQGLTKLRRNGMGATWTGQVAFDEKRLLEPLSWRKPRMVFVNSQSDLFYDQFSFEQIDRVFAVMQACPTSTFQVLTKYTERMLAWFEGAEERVAEAGEQLAEKMGWCHAHEDRPWPLDNLWLGASVEMQRYADERIGHLIRVPARVRYLSVEPLLEPVTLSLIGTMPKTLTGGAYSPVGAYLHWVIVGGESGQRARKFELDWARQIRDECALTSTAFFFKQAGSYAFDQGKRLWLKDSKGGDLSELPEDLRIRQFPLDLLALRKSA